MEIEVVAPDDGGAAGLANHLADGDDAHDAAAISIADVAADFTATNVEDALAELQAADELDEAALAAHLADALDAHDASAVSIVDAGGYYAALDVEGALQAIGAAGIPSAPNLTDLSDVTGEPPLTGEGPVWDGDSFELIDVATQAELDAHLNDAVDAHDASAISVVPFGTIAATQVQAALEEIVAEASGSVPLTVKEEGAVVDATVNVIDFAGADFDVTESPEDEVNVVISAAIARQAALDAHLNDAVDAHDASAISFVPAGTLAADDVQEALAELDTEKTTAAAALTATLTEISDQKRVAEILVTDPGGAAITVGDGKAYFLVPALLNGHNLVAAHAAVTTVSSSGLPTIQVNNVTQIADMLATRITIDANENSSYTALTPPVIDVANDDVATGDLLRIDIDVAGTGAKGLIVALTFEAP